MIIPMRKTLLALSALLISAAAMPALADTTYVILRHGEKPAAGLGQLSCQGLNRALALPKVILTKFGAPTALFAPNPSMKKPDKGVPYFYIRPLATIEPLAIQRGLPVDVQWGIKQIEPITDQLVQQPDGLYVIAWEHHLAVELARTLLQKSGADPAQVPAWNDHDFDSLYVIRRGTAEGAAQAATFSIERQGLDGLPDTCPQFNASKP